MILILTAAKLQKTIAINKIYLLIYNNKLTKTIKQYVPGDITTALQFIQLFFSLWKV